MLRKMFVNDSVQKDNVFDFRLHAGLSDGRCHADQLPYALRRQKNKTPLDSSIKVIVRITHFSRFSFFAWLRIRQLNFVHLVYTVITGSGSYKNR